MIILGLFETPGATSQVFRARDVLGDDLPRAIVTAGDIEASIPGLAATRLTVRVDPRGSHASLDQPAGGPSEVNVVEGPVALRAYLEAVAG
jgi:hypothetical protein